MTRRRIAVASLALILMAGLAVVVFAPARADDNMSFLSASATCTEGAFTIQTEGFTDGTEQFFDAELPSSVPGLNNTSVEVWDSDGTFLGAADFVTSLFSPGTHSGVIVFSTEATGPVTFRLYYDQGFFSDVAARSQNASEPGDTLADTRVVPIENCGQGAPGCDLFIPLTGAVVGQFVTDTEAFWRPSFDSSTNPPTYILAGKTLYVFGVDKSGQFAKVLLGCTFLWVPRNTVGPNPDAVWNNTPLPTTVVQ